MFGGKGSREEQIAHICQILVLAVSAPGLCRLPYPVSVKENSHRKSLWEGNFLSFFP